MRLWHYKLIPVLPRQQLLGQWRECCLIAKNIKEHGTPNHILVNKVMNYPIDDFASYGIMVANEMISRGYSVDMNKFTQYFVKDVLPYTDNLFEGWHDNEYLTQCFYNLEEKYDCGGISDEEWQPVVGMYNRIK